MIKNKKGMNFLVGTTMFVILNAIFFVIMFSFVIIVGSGSGIQEQAYAKKIALVIDGMKPGTEVTMDMKELYALAEGNNFRDPLFALDFDNSSITIRVKSGEGKSFRYFTPLTMDNFGWDDNKKTITITK